MRLPGGGSTVSPVSLCLVFCSPSCFLMPMFGYVPVPVFIVSLLVIQSHLCLIPSFSCVFIVCSAPCFLSGINVDVLFLVSLCLSCVPCLVLPFLDLIKD